MDHLITKSQTRKQEDNDQKRQIENNVKQHIETTPVNNQNSLLINDNNKTSTKRKQFDNQDEIERNYTEEDEEDFKKVTLKNIKIEKED